MINDTIFQYVICKFAYEDSTYLCKIRGVCKPEYMDAENAKTWIKTIFEFYDSADKTAPYACLRKGKPTTPPEWRKHVHSIIDYNWSACFTLLFIQDELY